MIVYSIPLQDLGVSEKADSLTEFAQSTLEELVASEGVQREPVFMDEQGVKMLEAAMESWKITPCDDCHRVDGTHDMSIEH